MAMAACKNKPEGIGSVIETWQPRCENLQIFLVHCRKGDGAKSMPYHCRGPMPLDVCTFLCGRLNQPVRFTERIRCPRDPALSSSSHIGRCLVVIARERN